MRKPAHLNASMSIACERIVLKTHFNCR